VALNLLVEEEEPIKDLGEKKKKTAFVSPKLNKVKVKGKDLAVKCL